MKNNSQKSHVEWLAEEEYPIIDGELLGITYNQLHSRSDFIKGYQKAEKELPNWDDVNVIRDMLIQGALTNMSCSSAIVELDKLIEQFKKSKQ